jgi:hypothetical protein
MLDLIQLLPHCKKDAKLDTKTDKGVINEVADMKVMVFRSLTSYSKTCHACKPSAWSWLPFDTDTRLVCRAVGMLYSLRQGRSRTSTSGLPRHLRVLL